MVKRPCQRVKTLTVLRLIWVFITSVSLNFLIRLGLFCLHAEIALGQNFSILQLQTPILWCRERRQVYKIKHTYNWRLLLCNAIGSNVCASHDACSRTPPSIARQRWTKAVSPMTNNLSYTALQLENTSLKSIAKGVNSELQSVDNKRTQNLTMRETVGVEHEDSCWTLFFRTSPMAGYHLVLTWPVHWRRESMDRKSPPGSCEDYSHFISKVPEVPAIPWSDSIRSICPQYYAWYSIADDNTAKRSAHLVMLIPIRIPCMLRVR